MQRRRHTVPPIAALLLALAGTASGEAQDGDRFKDWTMRCEEATEVQPRSCLIFQHSQLYFS